MVSLVYCCQHKSVPVVLLNFIDGGSVQDNRVAIHPRDAWPVHRCEASWIIPRPHKELRPFMPRLTVKSKRNPEQRTSWSSIVSRRANLINHYSLDPDRFECREAALTRGRRRWAGADPPERCPPERCHTFRKHATIRNRHGTGFLSKLNHCIDSTPNRVAPSLPNLRAAPNPGSPQSREARKHHFYTSAETGPFLGERPSLSLAL